MSLPQHHSNSNNNNNINDIQLTHIRVQPVQPVIEHNTTNTSQHLYVDDSNSKQQQQSWYNTKSYNNFKYKLLRWCNVRYNIYINYITRMQLIIWLLFITLNSVFIPIQIAQLISNSSNSTTASTTTTTITTTTTHDGRTNPNDPYNYIYGVGQSFGDWAMLHMLVGLLPIQRYSVWLHLIGLSTDKLIVYHKYIVVWGIAMLSLHGGLMAYFYSVSTTFGSVSSNLLDGPFSLNMSGEIALSCCILLMLTSLQYIRRVCYELFYYPHQLLALLFILFGVIHQGAVIVYCIPALILYIIDIYKTYSSHTQCTVVSCNQYSHNNNNYIAIEFHKHNFTYKPGQYVFIKLSQISKLQYHPFTLSSSPYDNICSVHIKQQGHYTKQVCNTLCNIEPSNIQLSIHGAFGGCELDLYKYNAIILISGGIGLTVCRSILRTILQDSQLCNTDVHSIWAGRDNDLLSLFDITDINKDILQQQYKGNCLIDLYMTTRQNNDNSLLYKSNDSIHQSNITTTLYYNRPNLDNIFMSYSDNNNDQQYVNIGVVVCGPQSLVNDVHKYVIKYNKCSNIQFDIHDEVFEW